MKTSLILTCEHGGNHIPAEYQSLFVDKKEQLASHEGYDLGALELANSLSDQLQAPLFCSQISRLLIDLNRSPHNRNLFRQGDRLSPQQKKELLLQVHQPHWNRVRSWIQAECITNRPVLHLAVHSFTPILKGVVRTMDIGLLYDPQRAREKDFCRKWKTAILALQPDYQIRMNAPYRGISDGLATALRKVFPPNQYLGIELEINARIPVGGGNNWQILKQTLATSLKKLV